MQLFFVYDTSFCKTERDDPRDAIIFFYPPQILDPQRCTVCCQLVGTVQLFQSLFSNPKIITLQKGKFAVKCCSRYLLALEANSAVPDVVVINQLESLYNVYCFYHKDIDRIYKIHSDSRSDFLQQMEEIWKYCLAVSCGFNNDIHVAFNSVPTILIPEAVSVYANIQALELLHSCQSQPGVIAGCVLFKHQILVTQFTSEISRYLTLVGFLQENFSPEDVPVPFQLPPGVHIIKVFLQKNALHSVAYANGYYAKQSRLNFPSFEASKNYSFSDITSGSEGDVDSDSDNVQNIIGIKKIHQNHTQKHFCSSTKMKNHMESQIFHSGNQSKSNHLKRRDLNHYKIRHKCSGFQQTSEQSKQNSSQNSSKSSDAWESIVNGAMKDLCGEKTQHTETWKLEEDCDTDDGMEEMCLFIHNYLNCVAVFLMEPKFIHNVDLIQTIWNSGLSVLSELEVLIRHHVQEPSKEKPKSYMYLCLEKQGRSLNGFPAPESSDQPVLKTLQQIHGNFENNPYLLDVSTVSCNRIIHACRSPAHEAFYYQEKPEMHTLSSYFTSFGSLPHKAVQRLEKSLGIFLP